MRLAQTDLRSLAVFNSVVEHQGFVGAQMVLGLSQSAVSFHIKALEDRLGFRLCKRGRGGFELTDRGAIVHQRSQAVFLAVQDFEGQVGTLRNRIVGTLRLGLIDNTLTDTLLPMPRVLARIGQLAPEARVDIRIDAPEVLSEALLRGDLEIAILPETRAIARIRVTPLHVERHVLYCGKQHPLFSRADEHLATTDIIAHPFVTRPYANKRELQHFPQARSEASASNIEAQAMFILSGRFLGYLPQHFAHSYEQNGQVRALLAEGATIQSPFVLATRESAAPTTLLDVFVRELVSAMSEKAHWVGEPGPVQK